jgi:hypothetical protein
VRELFQLEGEGRRKGEGNNRKDKGWKINTGERKEGDKTQTICRKRRRKCLSSSSLK